MPDWSAAWKASKNQGKQRKYRAMAPLHVRGRFLNSHLSKDLRTKYGRRAVRVRKGDKIKVLVGKFRGKSGTVERVDTTKARLYITGLEILKKDGSKALRPIPAHRVLITELNLTDKFRSARIKPKEAKK